MLFTLFLCCLNEAWSLSCAVLKTFPKLIAKSNVLPHFGIKPMFYHFVLKVPFDMEYIPKFQKYISEVGTSVSYCTVINYN